MSEFSGQYVMMPVKVICKECGCCERFDVETDIDVLELSEGRKICETDLRCRHLGSCVNIYRTMKQWEKEKKPVPYEQEGDPSNGYWKVCGECHGIIGDADVFCKHCGREIDWGTT